MINHAHLIYFSPTGTTKQISEAITRGLGVKNILLYDVTLPGACFEKTLTDGVAIIGVPVYAGRVPELCLQRLQGITSKNVPAILLAVYGNRAFEDALVELRDFAVAQGFKVIAAGAFIGEHSYSTTERPIAACRPDAGDLKLAMQFGKQVAAKIQGNAYVTPEIDGNIPYKERMQLGGIAPETDYEKCTLCGKCAAVCPPGVVTVSDSVSTHAAHCIMCCACVRGCALGARLFNHPLVEERRVLLQDICRTPKEPDFFI